MNFNTLDTVALARDLPSHGLRKGDLGGVVQVYAPNGLEVEFVTASGRTGALVTLNVADVRAVGDSDLISVRPFARVPSQVTSSTVGPLIRGSGEYMSKKSLCRPYSGRSHLTPYTSSC